MEEESSVGVGQLSRSLPASPSVRKKPLEPQRSNKSESSAGGASSQFTLESMFKNFEEFTQHQWAVWVRPRDGWTPGESPSGDDSSVVVAPHPSSSTAELLDPGSGCVVRVDKEKWIFKRSRKACKSLISPLVCQLFIKKNARHNNRFFFYFKTKNPG